MIILDYPFVSEFLEKSVAEMQIPILKNEAITGLGLKLEKLNILDDQEFISKIKESELPLVYSNSENSIDWISRNLSFTKLPWHINNFKDKVEFRRLISTIYPEFYYTSLQFDQLDKVNCESFKMPFIIKPAIGFFSIGVHVVKSAADWEQVVQKLKKEISIPGKVYPAEVVNASTLIIEQIIEGEEYAVDVYFNEKGEPVILNILKHLFSSAEDVSDRVYITSKEIIERCHSDFMEFLVKLGSITDIKNFPMHVEFRVDKKGHIVPIEVNPMRFAGWCVTDLAWYAYGINVYDYYFNQKKPDWQEILKERGDEIYSVVVADLPKDVLRDNIDSVNYDLFESYFEHCYELRKVDFVKHGVFAFLYARTSRHNMAILEDILVSDLKGFLKMKS